MDVVLSPKQQQHLSAVQLQSLHILSLPVDALRELLQKESEENPFIEYQPMSDIHDRTDECLNFTAAPEKDSVKNFILEQLNPQQYSRPQWALLSYLAGCVDDDGYLAITEQELAARVPLPSGLFTYCLKTLQQLDPAGICAYDIKDSLKLQLQRKKMLTPLLTQLIDCHLEDIAINAYPKLCHIFSLPKKEISVAIQKIKTLSPSPLKGFHDKIESYIVPDVIIRITQDGHETLLNDSWIASYSISDYYINMMRATIDPVIKSYFKEKYLRSYMLLHNVERRRQTLISLTNAIWDWQYDYFCSHQALRPMTLKDISTKTGLHVSTISRCTKDKYLQTPWHTVSFRSLFQRPLAKQSGSPVSHIIIKEALLSLIHREPSSDPYSDLQLLEMLEKYYHITVSRRVIQKYRKALGIANSYERRTDGKD